MRVKASSVGLNAEEYRAELAIETGYTGMAEAEVSVAEVDTVVRRGRPRSRAGPRPALSLRPGAAFRAW